MTTHPNHAYFDAIAIEDIGTHGIIRNVGAAIRGLVAAIGGASNAVIAIDGRSWFAVC